MTSFSFQAIGTSWQIDISANKSVSLKIKDKVYKEIEEFDKYFSRFRSDSWVVKCSKSQLKSKLPPNAFDLLTLYKQFYNASGGLFTPLIGKTLEDAGYDSIYFLIPKHSIYKPPAFSKVIEFDKTSITFKANVLLDFGAAGKGFLVDLIAGILQSNGINEYCIDASGDILHKGNGKIRVGLEHPDDPTLAIGVWEIENKSICASSGNRRKWNKYHHTINPFTLESPTEVKAVWVVADNAAISDGLATCLFLDSKLANYKDFKFEYVLLYKDNTVLKSKGFSGELFT